MDYYIKGQIKKSIYLPDVSHEMMQICISKSESLNLWEDICGLRKLLIRLLVSFPGQILRGHIIRFTKRKLPKLMTIPHKCGAKNLRMIGLINIASIHRN